MHIVVSSQHLSFIGRVGPGTVKLVGSDRIFLVMVRKSYGNSEPERIKENIFGERKNTISNFSRSIKMLESDQMRDIVPYVRTYILF